MQCQQFRNLLDAATVEFLEGVSDSAMVGAASPREQAAIGGLLRQRMSEDVNYPLGLDPFVDELETAQLAQLAFERPGTLPHRTQQAQREFPTDHRRNLGKVFCLLRGAIAPR